MASEYGWTPEYILEVMSYSEVKAMMAAVDLRYRRQKEATDQIRDKGDRGDSGAPTIDKVSPSTLRQLGVGVKQ